MTEIRLVEGGVPSGIRTTPVSHSIRSVRLDRLNERRLVREYAVHLFTEDGNEDVVHINDVDAPGALVRAMREFGRGFESIVIRDEVTGMTFDCAIRGRRR